MTSLLYAAALLAATVCMGLVDYRYRLVLWARARPAVVVLVAGVAFFLVWDLVAIASGHYHLGESEAMTGVMLAPDLPVEELLFIVFLCYTTLVLRALVELVLSRGAVTRS